MKGGIPLTGFISPRFLEGLDAK